RQQQSKQQERQQSGSSRTSAVGQNYYELLGISPKATVSEIRKAYHEKLKEYHPDRHQNAEFDWIRQQAESMTRLLGEAYEVLVHEEQRKRYDQQQQARS
ncbi:MAG: J domain-containing protein, partial [SAR324 cluster bacterium]|nr:J domain-containing protein [SAR324 cluster bacterium]